MVRQCQVCKKLDYLYPDISFHSFPLDNERRKNWFHLLGFKENKVLPKRAEICSNHFNDDDFNTKSNGIKYLKRDAIPRSMYVPPQTSWTSSTSSHDQSDSDLSPNISQASPVRKISETNLNEEIRPLDIQVDVSGKSLVKTDSSSTITASETEAYILESIHGKEHISDLAGPSSEFRGVLSLVTSPKKRKRIYAGDYTSDDFASPKVAKQAFRNLKATVSTQRKKIRSLHGQVRRLRAKITSMQSLLGLLKEKSLISESSEDTVKGSVAGPATNIFKRMLQGPSTQKYEPSLRAFALTLSFYSPRAYTFVRDTFNRSLPHLGTISKWFRSVDGSPGFTQEALTALKLLTKDMLAQGQKVLCSLMLDEMSIRKQVEWTGKKYSGYVDIGTGLDTDSLPEAREALVFMLVCINGSWKIPVGYFLIDGLSAKEKAGLVRKCLEFLSESQVTITSLTFDGPPVNFNMVEQLGCDFSVETNLKTFFKHPVTKENIFVYLDPSHMIKLIRNCFGSLKVLNDGDGGVIDWDFLESLYEQQNNEGLHAATKLKLRHMQWTREKMKVSIATQTLSKSVSDALLFLSHDLKLPSFENVDATAKFIVTFNNLFDIFNSHNRLAKYFYKKPLSSSNQQIIFQYLDNCLEYIMNLNVAGQPLLEHQRKTGFLGFLININSLKAMYETYVVKEKNLAYFPVYKISQDYLETFFGAIRSKGGFNNNPTARQFEAAYKRLIVHSEISGPSTGNVKDLNNIPILTCGNLKITQNENFDSLEESYEYLSFQENLNRDFAENDFFESNSWNLTDYVEDIVSYISGYVVKGLKKCVTCTKCLNVLVSEVSHSTLQNRKQFGKLVNASLFIIEVCKAAEKHFRFFHKTRSIFKIQNKALLNILIHNVFNNLSSNIYDHFGDHFFENSPVESHPAQLIKLCLKQYFTLRIHHETRKMVDLSKQNRIRSVNTKCDRIRLTSEDVMRNGLNVFNAY